MARLNLATNLNAFLDMIAFSELGKELLALSDDGYNVIVGSTPTKPILFHSYADHPRRKIDLPHLHIISTAAGRYQILARYYDAYKARLSLEDFGPMAQDQIAIQLIRECKALDKINAGQFNEAVAACRSRWASLPGAGYGQHENKLSKLRDAYVNAGGELAGTFAERLA